MKKAKCTVCLLGLLCLLLTSCHSPQKQGSIGTTAEPAETTASETEPVQWEICYAASEDISVEYGGATYYGTTDVYAGGYTTVSRIVSDTEEVTIPRYLSQNKVVLLSDTAISCPNLKTLTVNYGYEVLFFPKGESDLYRTEVLHLPNTYRISCYYGEGNNVYGKFTPYSANSYSYTAADLQTPFPTEFTELQQIHVAGNQRLDNTWSVEGMLYSRRELGTNVQSALVCIPQNYPSEDGTVTIPQQATFIQTHAVYHCRNIRRLVIPETTRELEAESVVATAEHPMTIVCAKGSAADEYVQMYGEAFHLTVEYLPE